MIHDDEDNVPAPEMSKLMCPQCVTTGTVNVLKDICKKQGIVKSIVTPTLCSYLFVKIRLYTPCYNPYCQRNT